MAEIESKLFDTCKLVSAQIEKLAEPTPAPRDLSFDVGRFEISTPSKGMGE